MNKISDRDKIFVSTTLYENYSLNIERIIFPNHLKCENEFFEKQKREKRENNMNTVNYFDLAWLGNGEKYKFPAFNLTTGL